MPNIICLQFINSAILFSVWSRHVGHLVGAGLVMYVGVIVKPIQPPYLGKPFRAYPLTPSGYKLAAKRDAYGTLRALDS